MAEIFLKVHSEEISPPLKSETMTPSGLLE